MILHRQGGPKPLRAFRPTHIKALDGLVGLLVVAVRNQRKEGSRLVPQFPAEWHNLQPLRVAHSFICQVQVRAVFVLGLFAGAEGDLAVKWHPRLLGEHAQLVFAADPSAVFRAFLEH